LLRVELINAAVRVLLREEDAAALTLSGVAREAGVSAPSIYRHFENREQLMLAVIQRLSEELARRRDAAEQALADPSPWDRLLARSYAYIDFGLQQPGPYRLLYQGVALRAVSDPTQAAFGQPMLDRTAELVDAMEIEGTANPIADAPRTALLIWTGLHGILTLQIDKDTIPWPDAHDLAHQMLTALVRPVERQS
jgi:AcrR family transcriptional regulator